MFMHRKLLSLHVKGVQTTHIYKIRKFNNLYNEAHSLSTTEDRSELIQSSLLSLMKQFLYLK